MERPRHTAHEGLWAPMFRDITVTPYHNAAQDSTPYPFSPNPLDGVYPMTSQHTLAGVEPSHALQNHREYGQTNGGTWTMP